MGNLFSCLGGPSERHDAQAQTTPKKVLKRRSSQDKLAPEEPAEPEGLKSFKRPPSKHRQTWVQDSTSSGTTAGIRPGGSSISTVGSMVSSNTLHVPSDDDRRPPGKRNYEEGPVSPIREDGGPSWERVEELNGEVSDLRQRLNQEKEEANRLKQMVERLRVSNSEARESPPDADTVPGPAKKERGPLSSVLATQRSAQQDTCESVRGADGSPEQMSRPPTLKEAHESEGSGGQLRRGGLEKEDKLSPQKGARSKRPSARRAVALGVSLDAQDMVELGSPVILEVRKDSAGEGSLSSSERGFGSSSLGESLSDEQPPHRSAPPLSPPCGPLIERRRHQAADGRPSGKAQGKVSPGKLATQQSKQGQSPGAETEHLEGVPEDPGETSFDKRTAARRQARHERAKARMVKRQANQESIPMKDTRQPLMESQVVMGGLAAASDSAEDSGEGRNAYEAEDHLRGLRQERRSRKDPQGASDSDMSFGGWLPETRFRRPAGSDQGIRGGAKFAKDAGTSSMLTETEFAADDETGPTQSFSFGQKDAPSRPSPPTQSQVGNELNKLDRANRVHKAVLSADGSSSFKTAPKSSHWPSSSDDSLGEDASHVREVKKGIDASQKESSPNQLLNTRERLAQKGVLMGPPAPSPESARSRKALWKAEEALEGERPQAPSRAVASLVKAEETLRSLGRENSLKLDQESWEHESNAAERKADMPASKEIDTYSSPPARSSHVPATCQPEIGAPVPRRPMSARTAASGASSAGSESVQVDNPFRIGLTSSQASVQRSPQSVGTTVDQLEKTKRSPGGQAHRALLRTSSEVNSRKPALPEPKPTPVARSRSFDAPNLKPSARAAHSGLPPRPTTGMEKTKQSKASVHPETDAVPSPFRTRELLQHDSPQRHSPWQDLQIPRAPKGARASSSCQSEAEEPPSKPRHRRRRSNGDVDELAALPDLKENDDPRPLAADDDVIRRVARASARREARGSPGSMRQVRENTVEVPGALWEEAGTPIPRLLYDGRGIANATDKYKEDQKVKVHETPFEIRVERMIARQELKQRRLQFPGLGNHLEPSTI